MSVTLTANYTELFSTETVNKIADLLEDSYALEDMLEFIDANSEEDFVTYYEDYVTAGENIGYDVVDAFVGYHGLSCVEYAEEAFQGVYNSPAEFAEEVCDQLGHQVPSFVVVDWQATWESGLSYDYDFMEGGYVFSSNF
jgi:hypothetical protein